jgi:hypothetical protein
MKGDGSMYVEHWHYDVVIWLVWPSLFPEYTETIWASDHFEAVEWIMRLHEVYSAMRVAVALCDAGGPARYERVWLASDGVHVGSVAVAA